MFEDVKVGDWVTRMLAGTIPMQLRVSAVTDDIIDCGWTFDRKTGAEIDEYLGWGPPPKMTGSYLVRTNEIPNNTGAAGSGNGQDSKEQTAGNVS